MDSSREAGARPFPKEFLTRVGHKNFEGDLTRSKFLLVPKFLLDFRDLTIDSKYLLVLAPPARFSRTISPASQPGSQKD